MIATADLVDDDVTVGIPPLFLKMVDATDPYIQGAQSGGIRN